MVEAKRPTAIKAEWWWYTFEQPPAKNSNAAAGERQVRDRGWGGGLGKGRWWRCERIDNNEATVWTRRVDRDGVVGGEEEVRVVAPQRRWILLLACAGKP